MCSTQNLDRSTDMGMKIDLLAQFTYGLIVERARVCDFSSSLFCVYVGTMTDAVWAKSRLSMQLIRFAHIIQILNNK